LCELDARAGATTQLEVKSEHRQYSEDLVELKGLLAILKGIDKAF
jgi:hypothetical protein